LPFRFHADGRPYKGHEWPLARSLLHGEVVTDDDIIYERGDATRGIVRLCSAPVRNSEGGIIAAVVVCEDVTGA
jgi:PAS domain-containing protein